MTIFHEHYRPNDKVIKWDSKPEGHDSDSIFGHFQVCIRWWNGRPDTATKFEYWTHVVGKEFEHSFSIAWNEQFEEDRLFRQRKVIWLWRLWRRYGEKKRGFYRQWYRDQMLEVELEVLCHGYGRNTMG